MEYRRFNINIKEAIDLNNIKTLFFKKPLYVMVSIVGSLPSKQRTSVAKYNANNPTWGTSSMMRFYVEDTKLQQNHLVLMIQLVHKRILASDKVIGEVCIPLKELYDNSSGVNNITNYITRQVVNPTGYVNNHHGYLQFSYEFGDMIRGPMKRDVVAYPLMQTNSHVTPSAPFLEEYLIA